MCCWNIGLLDLDSLACYTGLCLLRLGRLQLLEFLQLLLVCFEQLFQAINLIGRVLFTVKFLETLKPGAWLESGFERVCRESLLLN